jgi:hypothetical protein
MTYANSSCSSLVSIYRGSSLALFVWASIFEFHSHILIRHQNNTNHRVDVSGTYLFASTQLWCVDCDEETFHAPLFGILDDLFRPFTIFVDIAIKQSGTLKTMLSRIPTVASTVFDQEKQRRLSRRMSSLQGSGSTLGVSWRENQLEQDDVNHLDNVILCSRSRQILLAFGMT